MAMLSRGPPKDRDYDGASQLSQQQRRNLGDLGAGFPELRKVRTQRISSPGIKTFHTRSYTLYLLAFARRPSTLQTATRIASKRHKST